MLSHSQSQPLPRKSSELIQFELTKNFDFAATQPTDDLVYSDAEEENTPPPISHQLSPRL